MIPYVYNRIHLLLLCFFILVMTSCQSVLTPRIVLWHSWGGEQTEVINSAVNRFSQIFDDVIIVASYVPADEIVERYITTSQQGLGPDIFIAPDSAMRELASMHLITPLPDDALNIEQYYSVALATATFDNQYYGVPFAMRPLAMYYNRDMVETPAMTLAELLNQADAGIGTAINTQFRQIVWGIQSYGGQLLDDEGRVILNQGAFTNWLNWLLNANANPEIFLSRDATTLQRLFLSERVAYYTGSASELTEIRSAMGRDKVGVIPLPAGPNGASGPLMQSDIMMFNPSSAPITRDHALDLALFLTNLEQANTFMRDLELVPTNRRVRVDLRTYPAIAGFIAQTRTAIAISHQPQMTRLLEVGDDMLLRVLEGVIASNTASAEITTIINSEFGLETIESPVTCDLSGNLVIWHSLTAQASGYLEDLINRINQRCLRFNAILEFVPSNNLVEAYLEAFESDIAPDMLFASTSTLQQLVLAGAVQPVDRDLMQAFLPISQSTVSLGSIPYGVPIAIRGNVFYYNRDRVADTPITTDELLVEASPPFALSRTADNMLWTLTAYNGLVVSNDEITTDLARLTDWVMWLKQAGNTEHIGIINNAFLRRNEFIQGQSAYYIDSSMALNDLSLSLGDALGVAPFPTGTSPFASSLVTSLALFTNPKSSNIETALQFAEDITSIDEQERMAETLNWIPANTIADESLSNDPVLATITQTLQSGIVINNNPTAELTKISQTIDRILRTDQASDLIAQSLFNQIMEGEVSE